MFIVQQLAIAKLIAQRHYLTTVHDTANAWTGLGAALSTLPQSTTTPSSFWAITSVVVYLACISVMHVASTAVMQFTAYNSTSTISVPTLIPWPNTSVVSNGSWTNAIQTMPPISLVDDLQTNGLLNNTIYDILTTSHPSFTNATVNATSLQASCGLLSNVSYHNTSEIPYIPGNTPHLNFSIDGLGQGAIILVGELFDLKYLVAPKLTLFLVSGPAQTIPSGINQVTFLVSPSLLISNLFRLQFHIQSFGIFDSNCQPCNQYLFFLITTDVAVDGFVANNKTNLSCNIIQGR